MGNIVDTITAWYPNLKADMKLANIRMNPNDFVAKNLKSSIITTILVTAFFFLIFATTRLKGFSLVLATILVLVIVFIIIFNLTMATVHAKIRKREKEIDREVLFAGRYLLIKLNSGKPLINSLIDASKSYGASDKYFRDIVRDIELGTPIEDSLDNGLKYTPSKKFKRILFQIINALKIGIDITDSLEAVLDDIAEEQLIEIQHYGKKLNSFTMFYMLIAIVIPSLGLTLAVVVASLTSIPINTFVFALALIFLFIIQFMFIMLFKSIRPKVDI
jgi:flagellar protein FlaJ